MQEGITQQYEEIIQQVKELSSIYRSAASRHGISDNELWIWYTLLVLNGEYSQQEICDMWSLRKQTVNSITANLVKKNFVQLEIVPGTRNKKLLRLTMEGKTYGENIIMPIYQAEQNALKKMSEKERKACAILLAKYTSLLKGEINDE